MSPTLRNEQVVSTHDLDVGRRPRTRTAVRLYACALLAVALAAVVALAIDGAAFPLPGPVLLLAIPLALCMNRFVFFPNEIGVTADAAVIFAAIVAFHGDATWLGPLLIALLVGPLDAKHWGERAFVRMAFNSGSTALVTLAGVAVFVPLADALGSSWSSLVGAAALATIPYVALELVFGVALVVLQGERMRAAVRHQLPLNTIALPLALYGIAVGIAATELGWWMCLLLLPAALVPEVIIVGLRRRRARAPVAAGRTWLATLVWCAPMVGAAVTLALLWRQVGVAGGIVFGVGMLLVVTAASAWGSLPWHSRVLGPWSYRHLGYRHRVAALLTACCGALVGLVGATLVAGQARSTFVFVAATCVEAVVAMAMLGVRLWRFAPRRRAMESAVLVVAALTAAAAGWVGSGVTWAAGFALVAAMTVALVIAWPLAARGFAGRQR